MQDVDAVDRLVVDDPDANGESPLADDEEQRLALLGREDLRVREPLDAPVGSDDHGGRNDRPGQGSAPRLVEAGDPRDTRLPGPSLVMIRRRRRRRHAEYVDYCSGAVAGTRGARFSLRRAALPASPRR